jgi:hypothetical protein
MSNPALTDAELKVLSKAAALVPLSMRELFTRNVAARFFACGDLNEAIRLALGSHGVAVGRNALKEGRRA